MDFAFQMALNPPTQAAAFLTFCVDALLFISFTKGPTKRKMVKLLPVVFAALYATEVTAASASAKDPVGPDVLWLPLGDSITFGCTGPTIQDCHSDAGGYRVPLAFALSQPPLGYPTESKPGFNVFTCGTQTTGPSYVPEQWLHHEGHPGIQISGLDAIVQKAFASCSRAPDLVTILLGTNDCNANVDPEVAMPARMHSLLSHVQEYAPNASVFLADVVATGQPWNTCVQAFNKHVPEIVSAWQANMTITYTPVYEPALAGTTGVCSSTSFEDGLCGAHEIHPTTAGYPRMASAFAVSIMKNYNGSAA